VPRVCVETAHQGRAGDDEKNASTNRVSSHRTVHSCEKLTRHSDFAAQKCTYVQLTACVGRQLVQRVEMPERNTELFAQIARGAIQVFEQVVGHATILQHLLDERVHSRGYDEIAVLVLQLGFHEADWLANRVRDPVSFLGRERGKPAAPDC